MASQPRACALRGTPARRGRQLRSHVGWTQTWAGRACATLVETVNRSKVLLGLTALSTVAAQAERDDLCRLPRDAHAVSSARGVVGGSGVSGQRRV